MKLKDCLGTVGAVVSAPLLRNGPDDSWLSAYNNKYIPEFLYKFYVVADYFSFDKCPNFLKDEQKLLFPHLESAIRLIKESFEEYYELIDIMKKYDSNSYTPIKIIKGEPFDKSAPKQFNRCFQILIINMYSILDSTAEAIAIVLSWGNLGRGEFSSFVTEVKNALGKNKGVSPTGIIAVDDNYIEDIKNIIEKEIIEKNNMEWYELFKLYRNKQSHFRHYLNSGFHDKEGRFYRFLPRKWPYYPQQDMSYSKDVKTNTYSKDFYFELLIEQDIFEYCDGLCKKLFNITNRIFQVLTEAFKIKKDSGWAIDTNINKKVASLIKKYKFKQFG